MLERSADDAAGDHPVPLPHMECAVEIAVMGILCETPQDATILRVSPRLFKLGRCECGCYWGAGRFRTQGRLPKDKQQYEAMGVHRAFVHDRTSLSRRAT